MERPRRSKVRADKKKRAARFPRSPGEKSLVGDTTPMNLSRAMDRRRTRYRRTRRAGQTPRSWRLALGSLAVSLVLPIDPLSYREVFPDRQYISATGPCQAVLEDIWMSRRLPLCLTAV